jgi:hypothetical protein
MTVTDRTSIRAGIVAIDAGVAASTGPKPICGMRASRACFGRFKHGRRSNGIGIGFPLSQILSRSIVFEPNITEIADQNQVAI